MAISYTKAAASSGRSARNPWVNWQMRVAPYVFLVPFIVIFLVFALFPLLFSIYLSFHVWNPVEGLSSMRFVGVENYGVALSDPWLWMSFYNTLAMGFATNTIMHLTAIPVAYALYRLGGKTRHFYSSAYFLPVITSTVAVSLIFYNMYSADSGIINKALIALANTPGFSFFFGWINDIMPIRWLESMALVKPAVVIVQVWRFTGINIVIYISGLYTIPKEINEAAVVDGATTWNHFWSIALPALYPFIFLAVTLSLIGTFNMFEEPFILTRGTGGTNQAALTISMYLYKIGWEWLDMGTASALSWILFVAIGIATAIYFAIFGRKGMES